MPVLINARTVYDSVYHIDSSEVLDKLWQKRARSSKGIVSEKADMQKL